MTSNAPQHLVDPSERAAPLRVLVVDDDEVDRIAARRALDRARIAADIAEADDLAGATRALDEGAFDVVLLDHRLPGGDGLAVLDHVAARGVTTPVVVLTGQGDELLVATLMKRGAADVLPKAQVSPERLGKTVLDAVRTRRLELREQEARAALTRYAAKLRGLTEAGMRILASPTPDAMLERAAEEAMALFGVCGAEVTLRPEGQGLMRAARGTEVETSAARALRAPIQARPGGAQGELRLVEPRQREFDEVDAALLTLYARFMGVALENTLLLTSAQRAAQKREELLVIVTHDLRSHLGTISLGAAMLQRSLTRRRDELRAEVDTVQRVERSCKRMERIIANQLAAARMDAGTFFIEPCPLRASDVVNDAYDAALALSQAMGIALRRDLPDEELWVNADRERLHQLLMNLVDNALRVTPRGGEVTLSLSRDDGVCFSVRDAGPGIAQEDIAHLFDRYWQGERGKHGAAGVGLFIVKGIAEAHGGHIEVRSAPGEGCAFTLRLPAGR